MRSRFIVPYYFRNILLNAASVNLINASGRIIIAIINWNKFIVNIDNNIKYIVVIVAIPIITRTKNANIANGIHIGM